MPKTSREDFTCKHGLSPWVPYAIPGASSHSVLQLLLPNGTSHCFQFALDVISLQVTPAEEHRMGFNFHTTSCLHILIMSRLSLTVVPVGLVD